MLIVTRMDTTGGVQSLLVDFLRSAHCNRWDEVHLVYGAGESILDAADFPDVHFHQVNEMIREISPITDCKGFFAMRRLMRKINPDLVSTHSYKAGVLGRLAALSCGVKNIHTAHGFWPCHSGSLLRRIFSIFVETSLHRWGNGLICVNHADRKYAVNRLKLPAHKVSVIHNGCRDITDSLQQLEKSEGPCRIAFVGRMARPKQPEALIRYAAQTSKNCRIEIFGGGEELEQMQDYAREIGAEEKVVFHGFVNDVPRQLVDCDIFALISDWEGFPVATLEAMAAGLPVVVSDVGGAGEAVIEGENGFCIPRRNEEILFEKLDLLVSDPTLRKEMGAASYRLFQEKFHVDCMTEAMMEVYEAAATS